MYYLSRRPYAYLVRGRAASIVGRRILPVNIWAWLSIGPSRGPPDTPIPSKPYACSVFKVLEMNVAVFASLPTRSLKIFDVGLIFRMSLEQGRSQEKDVTGSLKLHPPMERKTLSAMLFFFRAVVRVHSDESPGDISMILKVSEMSAKAKLTIMWLRGEVLDDWKRLTMRQGLRRNHLGRVGARSRRGPAL